MGAASPPAAVGSILRELEVTGAGAVGGGFKIGDIPAIELLQPCLYFVGI